MKAWTGGKEQNENGQSKDESQTKPSPPASHTHTRHPRQHTVHSCLYPPSSSPLPLTSLNSSLYFHDDRRRCNLYQHLLTSQTFKI